MEFNNSQIRRQDRLLDEERAMEIIKEGEYGVLSMQAEDGEGAYGIPVSYVWDHGNSIYIIRCHSASWERPRSFPTSSPQLMKVSYWNVPPTAACTKRSGCRPSRCF